MVSPRGPAGQPGQSEGFRLSPGVVFLAIALVLSVVYGIYALTVRDTSQIPLLASGAVVVGIAFGALALYSLSAVWRAGDRRSRWPRNPARDRRRSRGDGGRRLPGRGHHPVHARRLHLSRP